MPNIQSLCCCDSCSKLGYPGFNAYKVDEQAWQDDSVHYFVGDLVYHLEGGNRFFYVCNTAHDSDSINEPPNNSYWDSTTRTAKCLYVEIDNLTTVDCYPLLGDDSTIYYTTERLVHYSDSISDKVLIKQNTPQKLDSTDSAFKRLSSRHYSSGVGGGCFWLSHCEYQCDSVWTQVNRFTNNAGISFKTYTDSYRVGHVLHIEFDSVNNTVEAVITGSYYPYSSGADGEYDPDITTDVPCGEGSHPSGPSAIENEYFRGTANVPSGWLDSAGNATSTITINNDYTASSDIGTVIFEGSALTGYKPLGRVICAAYGGTVKLTSPFASNFRDSIGNAVTNSGTYPDSCVNGYPSPCDSCFPPRPLPNPPGGGGFEPGDDDAPPDPDPSYPRYAVLRWCDGGGSTGRYVPTNGSYRLGDVFRLNSGRCVKVSVPIRQFRNPPPRFYFTDGPYNTCDSCEIATYELTSCQNTETVITTTDLSSVVDGVILWSGDCWNVADGPAYDPDDSYTSVTSWDSVGDSGCNASVCPKACDNCDSVQDSCVLTLSGFVASELCYDSINCQTEDYGQGGIPFLTKGTGEPIIFSATGVDCYWYWGGYVGDFYARADVWIGYDSDNDKWWGWIYTSCDNIEGCDWETDVEEITGVKCNKDTGQLSGSFTMGGNTTFGYSGSASVTLAG